MGNVMYLLLFAALLALNLNHKLFVVFAPFVAHEWDIPLNKYPLSLLAVQVSSVAMSLLGMLFTVTPKRILVMTQLVLAATTAVLSFCAPMPFTVFCVLRFAFGACRSPLISAVIAAVGSWVPEASRGSAIGWIETSYWLSDMLLPMGGAALAGSNAALSWLLALLALSHLVVGIAVCIAFPNGKGCVHEQAAQTAPVAYQKLDETEIDRDAPRPGALRGLLSLGPLICITWSLLAHVVFYVFLTIIGVWWHETFGLDSSTTGYCSTLIGVGALGGFLLNLALTDRFGPRQAVFFATCAMTLLYGLLFASGLLTPHSLSLALMASVLIFAFTEFGFLACMAWVTVACPEELAIPQLTMSLAFRSAAGIGSCVGTMAALPLYRSGGIALTAVVAVALYMFFLPFMKLPSS